MRGPTKITLMSKRQASRSRNNPVAHHASFCDQRKALLAKIDYRLVCWFPRSTELQEWYTFWGSSRGEVVAKVKRGNSSFVRCFASCNLFHAVHLSAHYPPGVNMCIHHFDVYRKTHPVFFTCSPSASLRSSQFMSGIRSFSFRNSITCSLGPLSFSGSPSTFRPSKVSALESATYS